MKTLIKKLVLAIALIFYAALSPAAAQENPGEARGFIWGVTKEDVREYAPGMYFDTHENALFFLEDILEDVRTIVTYEFTEEGSLWRVRMDVEERYTRPQSAVEDFFAYLKEMEETYGPPTAEDYDWTDPEDQKYPEEWGWIVYAGDLTIRYFWQTPETEIIMTLQGGDLDSEFFVTYTSKAVAQKMEQQKNAPDLNLP